MHMMQIHKIPLADVWSARVHAADILALYPGIKIIYMPLHEQQCWKSPCKILALISVRSLLQNCET